MMAVERQAAEAVSPQSNKGGWTIRVAAEGDEAAIRTVAAHTWAVTYAATVRPTNRERIIKQSYALASLRRSFSRIGKNIWFWVCEDIQTQQIVGFAEIVLWAGPQPTAELTRIYILPQYQRQGIGAALLDQTLTTLQSLQGYLKPPRLVLSVEAHNMDAISFYESRGFRLSREFIIPLTGQLLEMKEYVLDL